MRATRKVCCKKKNVQCMQENGESPRKNLLAKMEKPERPGLALVEWHV